MELHGSTDLRGPLKKEAINISMSFSATLWSGNVVLLYLSLNLKAQNTYY